jgi:hypothetical protein
MKGGWMPWMTARWNMKRRSKSMMLWPIQVIDTASEAGRLPSILKKSRSTMASALGVRKSFGCQSVVGGLSSSAKPITTTWPYAPSKLVRRHASSTLAMHSAWHAVICARRPSSFFGRSFAFHFSIAAASL